MQYRRIDKDTVQCIVTGEDLEEYGLSMTDIFERNERGEGFLRNLIEEAHEEVGYTCSSSNIAMQISPLKNNGMLITISEEPEGTFKNFLEHMKDILGAAGIDNLEELHALAGGVEPKQDRKSKVVDKETKTPSNQNKESKGADLSQTRVFEFESLNNVIEFAHGAYEPSQVRSCLVKADSKYYLVLMKNRMSWKNYNKLSAKAFEFSRIIVDSDDKLIYLGEHGEVIISNGALNKLSKI